MAAQPRLKEAVLLVFSAAQRTLVGLSLPPENSSVADDLEGATKLVNMVLLAAIMVPFFIGYLLLIGYPDLAWALMLFGAVMPAALWVYRIWGSLALSRDLFLGSLFLFLVYQALYFNSIHSPALVWLTVMPVVSVLLGCSRAASGWLGLVLTTVVVLYLVTSGEAAPEPSGWPTHYYAASLCGMIISVFLFVLMVEAARQSTFRRLNAANLAIKQLAERDFLTGLYNRRYIWETIEREEYETGGGTTSLHLLLIDLDHFKAINDTFGHVTGDLVLQKVADAIREATGDRHLCGRYGGEEFLLLLRCNDTNEPKPFAEALRRKIATTSLETLGGPKRVTVSIGHAQFRPGESLDETFRRADAALYRAKSSGRDTVEIADKELVLAEASCLKQA